MKNLFLLILMLASCSISAQCVSVLPTDNATKCEGESIATWTITGLQTDCEFSLTDADLNTERCICFTECPDDFSFQIVRTLECDGIQATFTDTLVFETNPPDCSTFESGEKEIIYDSEGLCAYVMANPDSDLAAADCDEGGVNNLAECTDGTDPTDGADDIVPTCPVELFLQKTAEIEGEFVEGNTLTYTFLINNLSECPATNVTLIDSLLGYTDGLSLPDIAAGGSYTHTANYTVTAADADAGEVANFATVTATDDEGNEYEASDSFTYPCMCCDNETILENGSFDGDVGDAKVPTNYFIVDKSPDTHDANSWLTSYAVSSIVPNHATNTDGGTWVGASAANIIGTESWGFSLNLIAGVTYEFGFLQANFGRATDVTTPLNIEFYGDQSSAAIGTTLIGSGGLIYPSPDWQVGGFNYTASATGVYNFLVKGNSSAGTYSHLDGLAVKELCECECADSPPDECAETKITASVSIACDTDESGNNTGTATLSITPTGGTEPYEITGDVTDGQVFNNGEAPSGAYSVTDANGCSITAQLPRFTPVNCPTIPSECEGLTLPTCDCFTVLQASDGFIVAYDGCATGGITVIINGTELSTQGAVVIETETDVNNINVSFANGSGCNGTVDLGACTVDTNLGNLPLTQLQLVQIPDSRSLAAAADFCGIVNNGDVVSLYNISTQTCTEHTFNGIGSNTNALAYTPEPSQDIEGNVAICGTCP